MKITKIVIYVIVLLAIAGCRSNTLIGRRQLSLVPDKLMIQMSLDSYSSFLKENNLSGNRIQTNHVKDVGTKMSQAVNAYLKSIGQEKDVEKLKWEFNLIADKTVNAWCMPGGKIVFYEGILSYTRDKAGIATVMGHEMAHAVLKHGNERMSQQLLVQMGGIGLAVALSEKPEQTKQLFLAAFGIGTSVGALLPYSRKHEYEADKIGMLFMARSGYNPEEAIKFWERMEAAGSKGANLAFMSTHPSHSNRIKRLKEYLPEAMKHYKNR